MVRVCDLRALASIRSAALEREQRWPLTSDGERRLAHDRARITFGSSGRRHPPRRSGRDHAEGADVHLLVRATLACSGDI
jgi:hypothetical protein